MPDLIRNNPPRAIALKVLSTLVFAFMLVCVKEVSDRVPPGEIVFARSFFALAPIVGFLVWRGELRAAIRTDNHSGHFARGLIGVTGMALWFSALGFLPLPEGLAITYASPLLVVIFGAALLGERIRLFRWTAVLTGLFGILVILWPRLTVFREGGPGTEEMIGAGLALGAALMMAIAAVTVRALVRTETVGSVFLYFTLWSSLCGLVTILLGWVVPTPAEALLLVLSGITGGVGQILLTMSFRYGETGTVAPFEYVSMIWATVLAFLFYGEAPSGNVVVGAGIVASAGIVIILRERRLGLERRAQKRSTPPVG